MANAYIKKIIKIGGSLSITLPHQWAKRTAKPGQEMFVVEDDGLRIFPVREKDGQVGHETQDVSEK